MPISPADSPLANGVEVDDREIHVTLNDGRILHVPIGISRRLAEAQPDQRTRYRLIAHGIGINWPDVDEDLSVKGLVPAATRVEFSSLRTADEAVLNAFVVNESSTATREFAELRWREAPLSLPVAASAAGFIGDDVRAI